MELARHVAAWSSDPSRRVGCVVIGPGRELRAVGYNDVPRGVAQDRQRLERPLKYTWVEHAERNAIYVAARAGISLDRATMYLPWFPCIECARAMIQAGITTLVANRPDEADAQWGADFGPARDMLVEAGVAVLYLDDLESA